MPRLSTVEQALAVEEAMENATEQTEGSRRRAPENETNADRFRRVVELRVNNALTDIRLIGQCSNRASYAYTENEAITIYDTLKAACDDMWKEYAVALQGRNGVKQARFSL